MTKFKPRDKETLKKDATAYVNKHLVDLDDKAKESVISKLVDKWTLDEKFKASEKDKTAKARDNAEKILERKEHYKKLSSKGTKQDKGSEYAISGEDRAYLHGKVGMTRTEVRLLIKSMKIDENPSWEKVMGGATYKGLRDTNDSTIRKMGGSPGASRGGSRGKQSSSDEKVADDLKGNLEPGWDDSTPK